MTPTALTTIEGILCWHAKREGRWFEVRSHYPDDSSRYVLSVDVLEADGRDSYTGFLNYQSADDAYATIKGLFKDEGV